MLYTRCTMEMTTGKIKLRDVFLDKQNWLRFYNHNKLKLRNAIVVNVTKMLACRTTFLGHTEAECPSCHNTIKIPHSCKSRFCSTCGKKATDLWIEKANETLPDTKWQHITFTMPAMLNDLFWLNRKLMGDAPSITADIILELAKKKRYIPGIFSAIHTFGRDIKRNYHIHLSTTVGGLTLDHKKWVDNAYFHHDTLKKMWKYRLLRLLKNQFIKGGLTLPTQLHTIKTINEFNKWLTPFYKQQWVVHLGEQSKNKKKNIDYLGKYLKRPPIGENRIKSYNGETVELEYLDHYTDQKTTMTTTVMEFIGRIVTHIHDKHFRIIRYYGFLANRIRGKLLPVVNELIVKIKLEKSTKITWRLLIKESFGEDPMICKKCGTTMIFKKNVLPLVRDATMYLQEIAMGLFPLVTKS